MIELPLLNVLLCCSAEVQRYTYEHYPLADVIKYVAAGVRRHRNKSRAVTAK